MSFLRSYRLPLLLCGCAAAACALIVTRELSAPQSLADFEALRKLYSEADNFRVLGVVSLVAGLSLIAGAGVRGRAPGLLSRLRTASSALWLALLLLASAGYFYGSRGTSTPYYPWLWDSFHYVLGAKYHRELGYYALYDCAVQADRESRHVLPDRGLYRDLASYRLVPLDTALRRPCHALFSARRWQELKRDLTIFQRQTRGYFAELVRDFGFNGTPVHAILAGELFAPPELTFENVARLTVIDVVTAGLTMAVIAVCFGEPLGAVLPLAFHRRLHERGAQLILGGFFVANAAVYGLLFTDYAAAAENLALSWLFGACTCATALYLAPRRLHAPLGAAG